MRDYGIDKGLIEFRDDSKRDQRGWSKGFWGFRKMFRDYLTKLNVAFYDMCCPAATTAGIFPVRYNLNTETLERFNPLTGDEGGWQGVFQTAGAFDSVELADGTVGDLAIKFGNDGNNGLYGVSDTVLGVAVEGAQVATFGTTNMSVNGVANLAGTMFAGFYPTATQQNITAGTGGAINVTSFLTTINTDAGGDAFTMAAGTLVGQRKRIRLVADGGGDGVVTPTSLSGGTTITFNDAGDVVDLIWNGTNWFVIDNSGATVA